MAPRTTALALPVTSQAGATLNALSGDGPHSATPMSSVGDPATTTVLVVVVETDVVQLKIHTSSAESSKMLFGVSRSPSPS